MLLPYLASIMAGIFYGATESINKDITEEKYSPFSYGFLQYFLNFIIFLIPAVFFVKLPPFGISYFYLVAVIIITLLANSLTIKAYKTEDISNISILSSVTLVTTVLLGVTFLAERLNAYKISGIILIILGIFVIFFEGKKLAVSRGLLIALIAKILWGFQPLFDKKALNSFDFLAYLVIIMGILSFSHLLLPWVREEAVLIFSKYKRKILLSRSFVTLGLVAYLWSIKRGSISIVNTNVDTFFLLVTVLIGIIILKERKHLLKKLVGCLVCILGIILLNLF